MASQATLNLIQYAYIAYYGRPADPVGQAYWANKLETQPGGLTALINAFGTSAEAVSLFGSMAPAQAVNTLYLQMFGREADVGGLTFYVNGLQAGTFTLASIALNIFYGATGGDVGILAAKLAAANAFTAELDTTDEILGYSGDGAAASARAFLSPVVDTASSNAAIANADDAVANIVNGTGSVFTLTSSMDVATANIFNAYPVYTPGGNDLVNSLQDEDMLTGTGTNPTLNAIIGSQNDGSEYVIAPVLNGIQTANFQFTGGDIEEISLQDATGLQEVNIDRITASDSVVAITDLEETVDSLSVSNATRQASVTFNYAEGQLEGHADELNLSLSNLRLSALNITQGAFDGDQTEDENFGFEVVNVNVESASNLDYFYVGENYEEEWETGTVRQTVNFTVDGNLELNQFDAPETEFINIEANANVDIADDEDLFGYGEDNDGIDTPELQTLTITGTGNVMIDGLNGGDDYGLHHAYLGNDGVDVVAGTMTGNLRLAIEEGTAANAGSSVVSGSGDDEIISYGDLGADVTTNDGDDTVIAWDDFEHTAQISTGAGNDVVNGDDLLADDDEDTDSQVLGDVERASISTGDGDDVVSVGSLDTARDWDHGVLNDGNADDLWNNAAASIDTGAGNDVVSTENLEENAMVSLGGGNDSLTVHVDTDEVLGADSDDAREVTLAGVVDTLGAVIDAGDGDDVVTFNNNFNGYSGALLVGNRAEVRGGTGTNVLNVNFVDDTDVVASAAFGDAADYITGFQTINLTAQNAVDDYTAALTGETQNDNWDESQQYVSLDVARVDTALATINLVSQEQPLLANPADELYEAGTDTGFELDNLRAGITVNLTAQEAGTSQGYGDGSLFALSSIADGLDEEFDVELDVDFEDATGQNDTFTLNVSAASGEFDLDLNVRPDTDAISGTGTDTDRAIENVVLNFADAGSHRIDMNGFGDEQHASETRDNDGARAADTSLTITSAAVLGSAAGGANEVIRVSDVNANDISIVVNADVILSLDGNTLDTDAGDSLQGYDFAYDHRNTYTITTGAGNDVVDLTNDYVDGDDTVDLGAGRNELVIANDVVINDVLNSDEIFEAIKNVQVLTLAGNTEYGPITGTEHQNAGTFGFNDFIDLAFMDDALATGIDTLNLVRLGHDYADGHSHDADVNLMIDTEFTRDLTVNIDSQDDGASFIVENVAGVDLDINATVADGITTTLYFGDAAIDLPSADSVGDNGVGNVDLVLNLVDSGTYDIADGGSDVDLYVQGSDYAQINTITINSSAAVGGTDLADITVDDLWNTSGTLTINASGVNATGYDTVVGGYDANGGINLDATAENDAVLNVTGTANDDIITLAGKTDVGDVVNAGAGDDEITGGIGNDTLTGGTGSDWFIFEATGAANGRDTITDFTTGARTNAVNGDVLDFSGFFGGAYGASFDMAIDGAGNVATDETDAIYVATDSTGAAVADGLVIAVDTGSATATEDDIAHLFQTTDQAGANYLSLGDGGKTVVVFGDHNAAGTVQVFLVDAAADGVVTNVDSTDVFLVGTLNALDLDTFLAANFGMMEVI